MLALVVFLAAGVANLLANYSAGMDYNAFSLGFQIGKMTNYQHVWSYSVLNVLSAAFILNIIIGKLSFFQNRVLVSFGRISYGMYVYHMFILFALEISGLRASVPLPLLFFPYLAAVYGVSSISYFRFEKPFLLRK